MADLLGATPEALRELLTSELGLFVLLGVFVLEGAMLLYFMPSELVVPSALLVLGDDLPTVAAVIAVAVCGATVGQYALFRLARDGGRNVLEHRWVRIDEARLERFEAWFERWGPAVVPVSNSLLFTRGMLTIPAGLAEMDGRQFVVLSAVGTLTFETLLATLYIVVGETVPDLLPFAVT
jgi:membrane protein DedA with SNARE-associated domain